MFRATFVGTGTAFSRRYGNTNIFVENDRVGLMIDFGFTSPERFNNLGRSLRDITHVAVSHIHADHIGGLEELAFMSRFVFRRRPTLLLPKGVADDLWNSALRGGLELVADDQGDSISCTLETYFEVVVLDQDWVSVGDLQIKAFANDHVPGKASYGFIVRDAEENGQMIFGCDCRSRLRELCCDPIHPDFAHGPIFHDCQLFDDGPSRVHIPFEHLLGYPAAVRERIILVHYNDSILDNLPRVFNAGFEVVWPRDVISSPGWQDCLEKYRRCSLDRDGDRGPRKD